MSLKKIILTLSIITTIGIGLSACSSTASNTQATTQSAKTDKLDSQGNRIVYLNFKQAIKNGVTAGLLDHNTKFYLSGTGGGTVIARGLVSNKRANAVGKSDEEVCERALHSALIQFQKQAKAKRANKITNLVSFYHKNTYKSSSLYECHIGNLMAAVTLKGDISR